MVYQYKNTWSISFWQSTQRNNATTHHNKTTGKLTYAESLKRTQYSLNYAKMNSLMRTIFTIFMLFASMGMTSAFAPMPSTRAVSVTSTTSLNMVFGKKKTAAQKAEEEAKAVKYWQGEWVCKDCGYIYNRQECAGMYFEEQGPGFRCPPVLRTKKEICEEGWRCRRNHFGWGRCAHPHLFFRWCDCYYFVWNLGCWESIRVVQAFRIVIAASDFDGLYMIPYCISFKQSFFMDSWQET